MRITFSSFENGQKSILWARAGPASFSWYPRNRDDSVPCVLPVGCDLSAAMVESLIPA